MLYKQLIQTGSVLLLLLLSSVLGFPLYKDTANGRAATHQLYSFAGVWFGAAGLAWKGTISQSLADIASPRLAVLSLGKFTTRRLTKIFMSDSFYKLYKGASDDKKSALKIFCLRKIL